MAMKIMGFVVYNGAWAEAYLRTKWHLDPSSRLATWAGNSGAAVSLFGGLEELRPHLTQCGLDRGLYIRTKWHLHLSSRLATTDGLKITGRVPFLGSWIAI